MGLEAGQLVGRQDRHDVGHAGNRLQAARLAACDSSPITPMIVRCVPRLRCGLQAQRLDALDDVVDLFVGDARFENDDHVARSCKDG